MTTTIYKCCNAGCRHMEDLKCTLDEVTIDNGGECRDFNETTKTSYQPMKRRGPKRSMPQVGDRFGRLVIVQLVPTSNRGCRAICQCDCGEVISRRLSEVGRDVFSCGCLHQRHGQAKGGQLTPEYRTWREIRQRCENPNDTNFHEYGGRGILVCERWSVFANFLSDMGPVPPGKTIDRIDNYRGYSPDNCRWATPTEQSRNRRNVHPHTVNGESLYAPDWAVRLNIKYRTLANYLTQHTMQEIYDLIQLGQRPKCTPRPRKNKAV